VPAAAQAEPIYRDFRTGLDKAAEWYIKRFSGNYLICFPIKEQQEYIMTEAAKAFHCSIKDAEELLNRFDEEKVTPSKYNAEALKRAGLVMAMAAWETYVKDRFNEEFKVWLQAVDGSQVGKFVRKRKEEDLKRFFNPNSERTKRLFMDYFEVDITQSWKWANYDVAESRKVLDSLVSKRGDAAHKANTKGKKNSDSHLVKRDELEKAIRFLIGLVEATDISKIAK